MMSGVRVWRAAPTTGALEGALVAIYEASFPEAERLPVPELARTLRDGTRWLFRAETDSEARSSLAGFGVVLPLRGIPGIGLLEYLATHPDQRGHGIGTALFHYLVSDLAGAGRDVAFEVEPEDPTSPNAVERNRRIHFYRSRHASIIPGWAGYCMPDLAVGGAGTGIPMDLWWATGRSEPPPQGTRLRALVSCIYAESYGITDPADPILLRAVEGLPER